MSQRRKFPPHFLKSHVWLSLFHSFSFISKFLFMTSCTQVAHCEPWDSFPHMANCEPFIQVDHIALPSVTLLRCHVASPYLAMCHPTPHASKNVKSRPPRNLTKFDVVAQFRETISTKSLFRHLRSRKIPDFYRNYNFALFDKIGIFSGLTTIIQTLNEE